MKKLLILLVVAACLSWAGPQAARAASVARTLPDTIKAGVPFEVVLRVAGEEPTALGVLEILPPGCSFHGQDGKVADADHFKLDPERGTIALAAFKSGELRYWVVADSATPGPFKGGFVDLLVVSPNPDEGAERFEAVKPDPSGESLAKIKEIISNGEPVQGKTGLPGDNGDNALTEDEAANLVCSYLSGKGEGRLDDACDAAYVFSLWKGKPKTLKDMDKREVVLYRPVERIITTNPDNSRTVIAMGREELIVGTDECTLGACICARRGNRLKHEKAAPKCWAGLCDGKLDQIPQTSTRKTVNLELMAGLNPDVILETTFWSSRANDLELKVGAPVLIAGADFSMQSFYDQIILIGQMLDRQDKAQALVALCKDYTAKMAEAVKDIPPDKRPRVYFAPRGAGQGFYDPKEGRDFTRTYRVYDPLDLAGGMNVAREITSGTEVNVSVEQIVAWNPEFIFVACSSPDDQGVDILLKAPELASIEAVKKGQVYNVLYPHCRGRPAPRNLVNILIFGKLLFPEFFKDMDLMQEGDAIYKAFLGVDGAFTEYSEYLQFPLAYGAKAKTD